MEVIKERKVKMERMVDFFSHAAHFQLFYFMNFNNKDKKLEESQKA